SMQEIVGFGGHNDFFIDSTTFYHPESFNCDADGLSYAHKMPLSTAEPKLNINEAELLNQFPPGAVSELERLVQYTMDKTTVEVPVALTRPNSLLWTLSQLLLHRRSLAEKKEGIRLPACILPASRDNRAPADRKKRAAASELDPDYSPKKKNARLGGGRGQVAPMIMKT
ncbi:hypothetical protein PFISCL1PPCAC_5163, partial [Pristionchus fissidentatus]